MNDQKLSDIYQTARETDHLYLQSFSTADHRPWGVLFWNTDNPLYYDANHADIYWPISEDEQDGIIEEVNDFYRGKKLIPRFYLYDTEKHQSFIRLLTAKGFFYEELESPVQVWSGALAQVSPHPELSIERVTDKNYEDAMEMECSIQEFGGKEVREKAFAEEYRHPAFQHYLLRMKGTPVSVACTFTQGKDARVESVATRSGYRGQGLIGYLLHQIQKEFVQSNGKTLWVFPINHLVEKVYQRYGFETIGVLKTGHAYAEGKGIKEIRGE